MTAYYNGGDDDGVGVAAFQLSHRLDAAREAHVQAVRDEAVSPVVRALLAPLAPSEGRGGG